MATNNAQNNQKERRSTNTSGLRFMNSRGYQASVLVTGFWDSLLKLEFVPELPEGQRTPEKRYDYKNSISTCITPEKAFALYTGYKNKIKPAIEKDEDEKIGIIISDTNLLVLASGADRLDDDGNPRPYIALYKDLNPSTRIAGIEISYEFGNTEIIENYNAKTGDFASTTRYACEIDIVMSILGDYYKAASNMYTHSERVVNSAYKTKVTDNQTKIGEKLGLELGYKPNNYSSGTYGSIFDKGSRTGGTPAVDEETLSSLEDLDL